MAKYEKGDVVKNDFYIAEITALEGTDYRVSWKHMDNGSGLNKLLRQSYVDRDYKKANVFGIKSKG